MKALTTRFDVLNQRRGRSMACLVQDGCIIIVCRVALFLEARMARNSHEQPYRARALKILPWICAHCGREFDGKKLSQLTVHHKDHNHDNNPPDGSNWELLCLYCHHNEHQRYLVAETPGETPSNREQERPSTFTPFAHLEDLLKRKHIA